MNTQKKNEIIESFNEKIGKSLYTVSFTNEMRDFLSKSLDLLSKEKEQEIVEMIKGMKKEEYYSCPRPTCGVEKCKHITEWQVYNQALDDILQKLTPSDREIL